MASAWTEKQFQRWLIAQESPALPQVGAVLVLAEAQAFERREDLLGLNEAGDLVIIEVKNEKTASRSIVGQALEYLANLRDITAEELNERYGAADLFKARFGRIPPAAPARRHVVLIAPAFKATPLTVWPFLQDLFQPHGVTFVLVEAVRDADGFELSLFDPPTEAASVKLAPGQFGLSPRDTLYCMLQARPRPVLWRIGRATDDGVAPYPKQQRPLRSEEHRVTRAFDAARAFVDLAGAGHVWQKRDDGEKTAVMLGTLRTGAGIRHALLRRTGAGAVVRYRTDREMEKWRRVSSGPADWPQLLDEQESRCSAAGTVVPATV